MHFKYHTSVRYQKAVLGTRKVPVVIVTCITPIGVPSTKRQHMYGYINMLQPHFELCDCARTWCRLDTRPSTPPISTPATTGRNEADEAFTMKPTTTKLKCTQDNPHRCTAVVRIALSFSGFVALPSRKPSSCAAIYYYCSMSAKSSKRKCCSTASKYLLWNM